MPRPIAAGVFGIARTIGVRSPSAASKARIGVPAAMERKSVAPLPSAASRGRAAPIDCGLTARTATAGSRGEVAVEGQAAPGERLEARRRVGLEDGDRGRTSPPASQPSSSAEPILPHPSSTRPRPEISASCMRPLPAPRRKGRRKIRRDRRPRPWRCQAPSPALAAPGDELERRVEPLAGGDGGAHHVVDLGRARRGAAGEVQAVAVAHQLLVAPQHEGAGPALVVGEAHHRVQRRRPGGPAAPCRRRRSAAGSRRGQTRRASPNRSASCPRSPWRSGRRRCGRSPRSAPPPGSRRYRWGGVPRSRIRARRCPCPVPSRCGRRRGITPSGR